MTKTLFKNTLALLSQSINPSTRKKIADMVALSDVHSLSYLIYELGHSLPSHSLPTLLDVIGRDQRKLRLHAECGLVLLSLRPERPAELLAWVTKWVDSNHGHFSKLPVDRSYTDYDRLLSYDTRPNRTFSKEVLRFLEFAIHKHGYTYLARCHFDKLPKPYRLPKAQLFPCWLATHPYSDSPAAGIHANITKKLKHHPNSLCATAKHYPLATLAEEFDNLRASLGRHQARSLVKQVKQLGILAAEQIPATDPVTFVAHIRMLEALNLSDEYYTALCTAHFKKGVTLNQPMPAKWQQAYRTATLGEALKPIIPNIVSALSYQPVEVLNQTDALPTTLEVDSLDLV